jgi:anti-sigma regulatory factor (Ser/Thr protein kinase)
VTGRGERFALELPNDPAFVATARLFASSLARHFEIDEDVVEDLKLAISEACKRALAAKDEHRRLSVSAAKDNGRLVFEIPQGAMPPLAEEDTPTPSNQQMAASLSLELISALFDDAEMATDADGQPVVRFSVPS